MEHAPVVYGTAMAGIDVLSLGLLDQRAFQMPVGAIDWRDKKRAALRHARFNCPPV